MNRVLIIAPHPDDEIIGCGGTILKHIDDGDRVFVFFVTNGELYDDNELYEDECKKRLSESRNVEEESGYEILSWSDVSARMIRGNYEQIRLNLEHVFRKIKPNIVYLPHKLEEDVDHILTFEITKEAYMLSKFPKKNNAINNIRASIYGYEVWTPIRDFQVLVNIDEYADRKKNLIALYESQNEKSSYTEGILGLNSYRGALWGNCKYAEVFTVIM